MGNTVLTPERSWLEIMSSKHFTKVVAACILGDGGVYIPPDGSKNAHFVMSQSADHADHVSSIKEVLETLTTVRIQYRTPKIPKGVKTVKDEMRLVTKTHPSYTTFRNNFYPNSVKVVHPHYLTLIDWEFLAIWYMQDGYNAKIKNEKYLIMNRIGLASLNFSYGDNMLLRHALAEKLNLHWGVHRHVQDGRQYWKLELSQKCIEEFIEGISPFMQPSFHYKLKLTRRAPIAI